MMHFDLIEMVTPAGSRPSPNEDRAGVGPRLARVIDGATETARAILAADPDFLSKPISPEILDNVRERRGHSLRTATTFAGRDYIGMSVVRLACRPSDDLVLMTDGFAKLNLTARFCSWHGSAL
jgi:hypothetical protein